MNGIESARMEYICGRMNYLLRGRGRNSVRRIYKWNMCEMIWKIVHCCLGPYGLWPSQRHS